MVVLASEIQTAMTISEISWLPQYTDGLIAFENLDIYLGLCSSDQLSSDFSTNYVPGSKVLVYHVDEIEMDSEVDQWFSVALQTPFQYDCQENLLIEIIHESGCMGHIDSWSWTAGPNRSVMNNSANPDTLGTTSDTVPVMMLSDGSGLRCVTFGEAKRLMGDP